MAGSAGVAEAPHFHPRFFIADKGYASRAMFRLVRRQYNADPVIDIPRGSKKLLTQDTRLSERNAKPWSNAFRGSMVSGR